MEKCLGDVILSDPDQRFTTLIDLVRQAGLANTGICYNSNNDISDEDYDQEEYKNDQLTLFIPTNEAFEKVPKEVLDSIMDNDTNPNALRNLLFG